MPNDYFNCPFNYEPNKQCWAECICEGCVHADKDGNTKPCATCASISGVKCNRISTSLERMPEPHQRC